MSKAFVHGLALLVASAAIGGCANDTAEPPSTLPQSAPPYAECAPNWNLSSPAPRPRLVVDASAAPGGDGSITSPFDSINTALDAARTAGSTDLVLAAGTYAEAIQFLASDTDLRLVGCGSNLEAGETSPESLIDLGGSKTAGVDITGANGVHITSLAVTGARRGVLVRQGAGESSSIHLTDLVLRENTRTGLLIAGAATTVVISDLSVASVSPEGDIGWGVAIQGTTGGSGSVEIEDSTISGTTGLGLMVDNHELLVDGLEVADVAPTSGGLLGRGLQLQNGVGGLLEAVTVSSVFDAGVFIDDGGRAGSDLVLDVLTVSDVQGVSLPNGGTSGDAVVVYENGAPSSVTLLDVSLNADRAKVVVDTSTLIVATTTQISETGSVWPVVEQNGGVVEDVNGGGPPASVEVDQLGPGTELELDLIGVVPDTL